MDHDLTVSPSKYELDRLHDAERAEKETGVQMEKAWFARIDAHGCEVCRKNQEAGWIGLHDAFPSAHQIAPAHPGCRCRTFHRVKPAVPRPSDMWESIRKSILS